VSGTAGAALFWGAFSSASLFLGQALAGPLGRSRREVGLMTVLGFLVAGALTVAQ
jgi:ZIP family zinc transporter